MGVSWHSHAEVISLEPEKIKQLIEEINNDDNYNTASIDDLRIEDNSVFFNSGGYGCYGYEEGYADLLFEILLEKYEGAIACFEYVQPCQSQGYYFTTGFIKSEGEVDWNDEENCLVHKQALIIDECILDDDEKERLKREESGWDWFESEEFLDFQWSWIWSIAVDSLFEQKHKMPSLYSNYQKCGDNEAKITTSLLSSWYDDQQISDDELSSAINECELDCLHTIKNFWDTILNNFEGELPDDFPCFKMKSDY
ncbi:hypothetical protein VKI21_07465 [Cyanobacterium aponinum UTEX 3222]|uniref:hypothetical protein n=1 Tax=Cyanobacterium aponinum TaxID=379064 RepID=UPI002B4BDE4E|nr:hypothetical protein [Cyanobacterium aponinum]WRL37167.1 hypothetical protein VKI22_11050 [Cyanobacterium aponinum UTEX 3221]WRL43514.1 hypothetical protein VKI21_07465 [Cyanobacterium aponinum UTEX 3222]